MTSILIADDQELIRAAVRSLLQNAPGMTVVGEAADGVEAVELTRRFRPDVVLMDIRMPAMDGLEATRSICGDPDLAGVRVLILTTFEEDAYIIEALRAGASGFIGKGTDAGDLIRAILTVHLGDALLSPLATRTLIDRYVVRPRGDADTALPPVLASLTERELEVLRHVARGRSNTDIAGELGITQLTVKTHVNRVMTKLDAHDRAQLVVIAYECGFIRADREDER